LKIIFPIKRFTHYSSPNCDTGPIESVPPRGGKPASIRRLEPPPEKPLFPQKAPLAQQMTVKPDRPSYGRKARSRRAPDQGCKADAERGRSDLQRKTLLTLSKNGPRSCHDDSAIEQRALTSLLERFSGRVGSEHLPRSTGNQISFGWSSDPLHEDH
jgi:hypothetical protein